MIFTKKYVLYILFIFFMTIKLFSLPLLAMNIDDIPGGKCLIKNNNEYLYVSYDGNEVDSSHPNKEFVAHANKHRMVQGNTTISAKSSFLIEKVDEGYRIKNLNSNVYLFLDDWSDINGVTYNDGCRVVRTSGILMANSYFDIIKKGDKYIIKNKKFGDYIDLNPIHVGYNDAQKKFVEKQLWSNKTITEHAYFVFKPYPEELF